MAAEFHIGVVDAIALVRAIRDPNSPVAESRQFAAECGGLRGYEGYSALAEFRMNRNADRVHGLSGLVVQVTVRLAKEYASLVQEIEEIWARLELAVRDTRGPHAYEKKGTEMSERDVAHQARERRVLTSGPLKSDVLNEIEQRLERIEQKAEKQLAPIYNLGS